MNSYAVTTKHTNGKSFVFLIDAESEEDAREKFEKYAPCSLSVTNVKRTDISVPMLKLNTK